MPIQNESVSVVVPSYNHAPFVAKTLRSIFSQTLQPEKLIVIDDGSVDESVTVIEKTLSECPFGCELIVNKNKGLCATLNEGLSMASGEFFAYLGSDDLWFPGLLRESVSTLKEEPDAALSFSDAYLIDENDFIIDRTDNWGPISAEDILDTLLRGRVFPSTGVVYRSNVLREFRWDETSDLEDYGLYLRIAAEHPFARTDGLLSAWRQHGYNTSSDLPRIYREFKKARDAVLPKLGIDERRRSELESDIDTEMAVNLARHGFRRQSIGMIVKRPGEILFSAQAPKLIARLLVPKGLFKWNRRRKHAAFAARHGKLEFPWLKETPDQDQ